VLRRGMTWLSAMVTVVAAAGCGGETQDPSLTRPTASISPTPGGSPPVEPSPEAPTPSAEPGTPAPRGTVITTGDSEFGPMLFDAHQQAIYIWEVEKSPEPQCYDDCEAAWPPVLTEGEPVADGAVRTDLLGTSERRDGSLQVTYAGHPLYFYAHEGPGDVECHNVSTHGGLWWVVQPDGKRAP
jgi:predicted lipoprotein with Yx(FWY)xxD motif